MARAMEAGEVPIVPGFQGLSPDGRVTTLGRGGSDTSAVALAAALKADRCDIYTDVDGVYTTDPRIVEKARKLDQVTYEEMLEMASLGAKVLQTRSVELAMKHHVRVQVLSSFVRRRARQRPARHDGRGRGRDHGPEAREIRRERHRLRQDEAKITLTGVPDRPGVAAAIFGPLADGNINVDMIVQNVVARRQLDRHDLHRAAAPTSRGRSSVLERRQGGPQLRRDQADNNVAKVSVIGVGMRSHAGVAPTMFEALADQGRSTSR